MVARRRMLRLGGLAAAGAAGAAVATALDASPVGANTGTMVYGTSMDENLAVTTLNGSANVVFEAINDNVGVSLKGTGTGSNVVGVYAQGGGSGEGVKAYGGSNGGDGLKAYGGFGGKGLYAEGLFYGAWGVATSSQGVGGIGVYGFGSGAGIGVAGDAGPTGPGVFGRGMAGEGVKGTSQTGTGVAGTGGGSGVGVQGTGGTTSGTGVSAKGGLPNGVGVDGTGVGTAPGVRGLGGAANGFGVVGTGGAPNGTGVIGQGTGAGAGVRGNGGASAGPGVFGSGGTNGAGGVFTSNGSGPAVQAVTGVLSNGIALDVHGKTQFTRSGVVTIPAGATSATTSTVLGGLTASSHVLATMQTNTLANVLVKSATPNTGTGTITVKLSTAAPLGGVVVAWFVFG